MFLSTSSIGARTSALGTSSRLVWTSARPSVVKTADYCKNLVQRLDRDAFLTSYFYPPSIRPSFFAIRAFNIETATVKDQVSNSALGRIRMQWWRDTVKSLYRESSPIQHPVALALHDAVRKANIPEYHLNRIIDARDQDFDNAHHMTMESLRAYSESTSSTILYILIPLLVHPQGPGASRLSDFSHAASHLGFAQTIITLIRSLPYHASKRYMPIPTEVTAKHSVSHEDVFRYGGSAKGVSDAVYEFACVAKEELDVARSIFAEGTFKGDGLSIVKVPPEVLPIFLSGVPIASYLSRLESVDFNAFHTSLQFSDWKLPFQVWRNRRWRRF
ncbi:isoprenoid synthase domain-containing protein [Cantharellus anzutake]|uniref:isoprenoid synthase domain-containing protein n=1 Tax=Cantharellus anzutake TaxID=1750568 RepID=UPI001905274B|nr:isoprenoid synthase domain-containing protein [Cantharellus anzutake]KAF8321494.1 isoprenoid synthase domain-containing protein [Cantharellus anzutake]